MTFPQRMAWAALMAGLTPPIAHAGPISAACLTSGREEANRSICACAQSVADQTLDGADQRRAARFFRNPELAHKTFLSDTPRDDAFWARWTAFGAQAELYCAPLPPVD